MNSAEAAPVSLFSAYYRTQSGGAGIHSPEVCLPADGWEIFSIAPIEVALPSTAAGTIPLNRAVIQKGLDKQLVYYWFESGGERSTNDMLLKLRSLADHPDPRPDRRRAGARRHADRRRRRGGGRRPAHPLPRSQRRPAAPQPAGMSPRISPSP